MKKTLIVISILVAISMFMGCFKKNSDSLKITPSDISKSYEKEDLGLQLSYPETYTVEEEQNSITMYHYKEQPVPYFVINFSEKTTDMLINELKEKVILKEASEFNDKEAIKITIFNKDLAKNIDLFYIENKGKTFWFSCFDGLYDEICNSIKFED